MNTFLLWEVFWGNGVRVISSNGNSGPQSWLVGVALGLKLRRNWGGRGGGGRRGKGL